MTSSNKHMDTTVREDPGTYSRLLLSGLAGQSTVFSRFVVASKLRLSGNSYRVGLSREQDLAKRCSGRGRSARAWAEPRSENLTATGEAVEESGFRLMGPDRWARLRERPLCGLGRRRLGSGGKSGKASVWRWASRGPSGRGTGRGDRRAEAEGEAEGEAEAEATSDETAVAAPAPAAAEAAGASGRSRMEGGRPPSGGASSAAMAGTL